MIEPSPASPPQPRALPWAEPDRPFGPQEMGASVVTLLDPGPHRVLWQLEPLEEVLEAAGLKGLESKPFGELSGGQRQRVAIARALVNHPSILLADEPTGALDSKTSIEIMHLFEKLHEEGNTIILVTHEPEIASRAHRVITIRDGLIEKDERLK